MKGGRKEEAKIYEALSSNVRREILDLLLAYGQMDLKEISEKIGLREITVRHHISILEQSGLIESFERSKGTPGRPKRYYRVVNKFWNLSIPKRQYALLSHFLLENVIKMEGEKVAIALMKEMGKIMGKEIIRRATIENGVEEWGFNQIAKYVIPKLEDWGCIPKVIELKENKISIQLFNCVFYELAKAFIGIVCEGHKEFFQTIADVIGNCEVELKSCIAEGDKTCITEIRLRE